MDTTAGILSELTELTASVLFGIGLVLAYQGMDLLRRFLHFSFAVRLFVEMIFWMIVAIIAYWLQYRLNYGILRFFFFLGAVLGILACRSLTKPAMSVLEKKADRSGRKRVQDKKNRRLCLQNQLKKLQIKVTMKKDECKEE